MKRIRYETYAWRRSDVDPTLPRCFLLPVIRVQRLWKNERACANGQTNVYPAYGVTAFVWWWKWQVGITVFPRKWEGPRK